MTDIVERLNDSLVWASPRERALRTEAAAEIVRLRGEVAAPKYDLAMVTDMIGQLIDISNGETPAYPYHLSTLNEQFDLLRQSVEPPIAPAEAKGDGDELKSIANDIALLRERGTPLSRELALIELRIRSAAEAANTPQPADGEAVEFVAVPDDYRNQASGYRAGWTDAMNAAPVQAAPQEGEVAYWERWHPTHGVVSVNREPLGESIVDNRWEDRPLYRANPSACELGAVREAAELARELLEAGMLTHNGTSRITVHATRAKAVLTRLTEALQHRGDSRGGEGS